MESNTAVQRRDENDTAFLTRVMQPDDCEEVYHIVEKEFRNWTLEKFRLFSKAFPSNVFVTVKRDTKEIVSSVAAIPTCPGQYFVAILVVRKDFRGKGLGTILVNYVIDDDSPLQPATFTLTSAKPWLDGVYGKIGFQAITPTHYIIDMTPDKSAILRRSSSSPSSSPSASLQHHQQLSDHHQQQEGLTARVSISEYMPNMFEDLHEYDTNIRGYDGGRYLSVLVNSAGRVLIATSGMLSSRVVGYVVGVDEMSYLIVDGLYADSDDIAVKLFSKLLDAFPGHSKIQFVTTKPRDFLTQFCTTSSNNNSNNNTISSSSSDSSVMSFECSALTRMAIGQPAPMCLSKVYAITDYTE